MPLVPKHVVCVHGEWTLVGPGWAHTNECASAMRRDYFEKRLFLEQKVGLELPTVQAKVCGAPAETEDNLHVANVSRCARVLCLN